MIDPEELSSFKAYAIERSRDPAEGLSARQRALMACIVIPPEIQKWMLEAGAVEPLLDSIERTILAAEEPTRIATAEIEQKLRDALSDCVAVLLGQISGIHQKEGVIAEAVAALNIHNRGED